MRNPSGWKNFLRLGETVNQLERNIDEELRFHIEGLTEELMAQGMSEEEARSRAFQRFGTLRAVSSNLEQAWSR